MISVGIFTGYYPYAMDEVIRRIKASEFNCVQLDISFKDFDAAKEPLTLERAHWIRDAFRDANLPIITVSGYTNIIHPDPAKRKALFVNVAHTAGIEGLTEAESAPLLQFLFAHQVKPEFTCRFVWQPGSLAFWDNRCAQHNPVNDYHGHRRVMHRITLAGDRPR